MTPRGVCHESKHLDRLMVRISEYNSFTSRHMNFKRQRETFSLSQDKIQRENNVTSFAFVGLSQSRVHSTFKKKGNRIFLGRKEKCSPTYRKGRDFNDHLLDFYNSH